MFGGGLVPGEMRTLSDKRRCEHVSEPGVKGILLAIHLAIPIAAVCTHVTLHVCNIIELWYVAVFLHVWPLVLGHSGDEIFDHFIRDERVS